MYNYNLLSLSSEKEKECFEQFAKGNDEARSMLIENNIRFVVHIANKYRDMKIEWEDLISMGNIGLIKGVDSFDPSKGKFSTYIGRCIENEILMGFRKEKRHFGVESLQ
jgi:RNA polymerase sporulation-specific sigma factor